MGRRGFEEGGERRFKGVEGAQCVDHQTQQTLTSLIVLPPLASPPLTPQPPQTPDPLPLLLVAKLPRHPPDPAPRQAQHHAQRHRREPVWGALPAGRRSFDSAYAGLDKRSQGGQRPDGRMVLESPKGDLLVKGERIGIVARWWVWSGWSIFWVDACIYKNGGKNSRSWSLRADLD